uniref:Uncharacterized protein n=1 Tax=Aegilops tauschii subsp. strangulata TaxID=200361 RepID=A0A453HWK9_AEGTS
HCRRRSLCVTGPPSLPPELSPLAPTQQQVRTVCASRVSPFRF